MWRSGSHCSEEQEERALYARLSGLIAVIGNFELSRDVFNTVFMAISAVKAHKTLELTENLQYTKNILAFVNI